MNIWSTDRLLSFGCYNTGCMFLWYPERQIQKMDVLLRTMHALEGHDFFINPIAVATKQDQCDQKEEKNSHESLRG